MHNILVIEKESTMMSRASYVNQARVHNGYHYPRSILTAARSAANFPRFIEEYHEAVVNNFDKYYAVSRVLSKINSRQFTNFIKKINVPIEQADNTISKLFNPRLTENVFKVREYAFDSHILRDMLLGRIKDKPGIVLHNNEEVQHIQQANEGVRVQTNEASYFAGSVLNTTYSQMNLLHRKSGLPILPLKHEIAEMALIKLPPGFKNFSVTVMDGPFFSIMPFPSRGLHTLSHVRYTPHMSWLDGQETSKALQDAHKYLKDNDLQTNYSKMYADVVRYIPALSDMEYIDSIKEVKTVLQKSEGDDSRPILFKPHFGIMGYACIMGGKLDNIYDVFEEITSFYEEEQ